MNLSHKNTIFFSALSLSTLLVLMWMFALFSLSNGSSPAYEVVELTILLTYIFSAAALFHNAHCLGFHHIIGRGLYFIFGGIVSFIISHLIWIYYAFLSDSFIPFPSLIDVFYILMAPFFITGLWYLLSIYNAKRGIKFWAKVAGTYIITSILFFIFVGTPFIGEPQTNGQQFFNIIYPLTDIAYLTAIIVALSIIKKRFYKGLGFIMLAMALIVIVDIRVSIEISQGAWIEGGISDQLLVVLGFLIGIGGIFSATHFHRRDKITKKI